MILLDSSCWIEYFSDGILAREIKSHIKKARLIIVPTLVIFEVYRKITRMLSAENGLATVGVLCTYKVTDLTQEIALLAADLSIEHGLSTADSIVLATAHHSEATLVTLDNDFSKISDVKILRR